MIITPWQMYWITRLDSLSGLFVGFGLLLLVAGVLFFFVWKTNWCEGGFDVDRSNLPVAFPILGLFLMVVATFIPSTKEMAAILIVPRIVNNEKVQAIPSKVMELATDWLEELKPKKDGGKR